MVHGYDDMPLDVPSFVEQRVEHRRRVLKSGTLYFNGGNAIFDCVVRNLTDDGAMLEMGETTGVPKSFELKIDDNEPVSSAIMWRTKKRIGLKFLH